MAQDIISDALNQIMNAKKSEKSIVVVKRISNFLIEILDKMKHGKYIDFKVEDKQVTIKILNLNECKSIKPRFSVSVWDIERYARRFLPSRNLGIILISTSKGIMDQNQAKEKNIGGSLIAYFY